MARAVIVLVLLAGLLPASANPQSSTPANPVATYDLDRDIADYEDTLRKIRDERWVYIAVPDAGVLIPPDEEAGLFTTMILLGMMSPDSVAAKHRELRARTRILQQTVEEMLEQLRDQRRQRELGPPPPQPPMSGRADQVQGEVSGTWAVYCRHGEFSANEAGDFVLRLSGNGSVSGTYTGPQGRFSVGGTVDDAGNVTGAGAHPDGRFSYFAHVIVENGRPRLSRSGTIHFVPTDTDTRCTGGELQP